MSVGSIGRNNRLSVEGLRVAFDHGRTPIVRDVSFEVRPGEAYGLVGESGCGKSLMCLAIIGLLPPGATATGEIAVGTRADRAGTNEHDPGARVGMIFQDPMSALNPVLRVGDAIAQVVASHDGLRMREARKRAVELMRRVGIRDGARRARDFPHQFSGGMRQRIVIAMALAVRPAVLLADEPTTALDVVVQAGILQLLDQLRREEGMSLLLVSHDFSIVAGVCERVGVMYAGELVEEGAATDVLGRPRHPYTTGLLESLPHHATTGPLPYLPGAPPDFAALPPGCAFEPRCRLADAACRAGTINFLQVAQGHRSRCLHVDRLDAIGAGSEVTQTGSGGA